MSPLSVAKVEGRDQNVDRNGLSGSLQPYKAINQEVGSFVWFANTHIKTHTMRGSTKLTEPEKVL